MTCIRPFWIATQSLFVQIYATCSLCHTKSIGLPHKDYLGCPPCAAQAGFHKDFQSRGWFGRTAFCSPGWFLQVFQKLWLVWAKPFLQPGLVFIGIPRAVAGMGETLSAAQIGFHTNSQGGALGVGAALSAAQVGFYRNSQGCAWRGRNPFAGIPRPVSNVSEPFYAAQAAFGINSNILGCQNLFVQASNTSPE